MAITGTLTADFSGFLKAIEQAENKMVDLNKGAAGVSARLDTLSTSFSGRKIIQEATLMAEAVERAGGTSRLTASELERVGARAAAAAEKMRVLGYDIPPGIQKLADETAHLREVNDSTYLSFQKLVGSYLTAEAIIGGVKAAYSAFTGEITRSITAAAEAEKAHNQLVAALKAQGTATPEVVEAFGEYATALQRSTIYQDDAIESAEALLVLVGNVMPRDMEKALKATTDLASGLGKDLNDAALLVAKAAEGNTGALKKSGIVIDETKAKAEGFGYVLDEIAKKFGGQAEALAGTYQGRLIQLGNTWNNVEESIGRVITQNATVLRAFELINGAIDTQTGELKDNATATNLVSEAIIVTVGAFSSLLQAFDLAQTLGSGFMITIRNMGAALGNITVLALQATRALQFSTLGGAGVRETTAGIKAVEAAVQELGDRNAATTVRSAAFGTKLQEIAYSARQLQAELEKTRGKTVELSTGTDTAIDAFSRTTQAIDTTKEKTFEFTSTFGLLDGAFNQAADGITIAGDHIKTVIPVFAELARGLEGVGDKMEPLKATVLDFATTAIPYMSSSLQESESSIDKWAATLQQGVGQLPRFLEQAFTGGGGISGALKALTSNLGSGLLAAGGPLNAFGNFATKAAFKVSEGLGNAVGAILPGIGSLIGPAIQGITALFGKLFDNPEKRINPLREAFVQAAGGLEALNQKAAAAGVTLDNLLHARNEAQYKSAIDELTKAFARQEAQVKENSTAFSDLFSSFKTVGGQLPDTIQKSIQKLIDMGKVTGDVVEQFKLLSGPAAISFKTLSDIAQRAGADLKNLGPAFESARLSDLAQGIVNDFHTLEVGLGSVDEAIQVMKKPINDLVNESLKAGKAIPENFRPWVEQLARTGQLVDENGNKIEDISGLKFADPIVSEFQKIVDKLQELIDKISGSGGITDSINGIPDRTVNIGFNVAQPDIPEFRGQEPIYAAGGYDGVVTSPTLFVAGEAGAERVSIGQPGSSSSSGGTPQWAMELIALMRGMPRAFRDGALGASI